MPFLFFITTIISISSCQAQKLVQTVPEASKLKVHKDEFIGKPLKNLIDQIVPQIKSALGDPDKATNNHSIPVSFLFVDKKGYFEAINKGENPMTILVYLKNPNKNRQYPKLDPTKPWTKEQTKTYGDMILMKIDVLYGKK